MNYKLSPIVLIVFMSFSKSPIINHTSNKKNDFVEPIIKNRIELIYSKLDANQLPLPNIACFTKAMEGYYNLKEKGLLNKEILTIVDYSLSSTKKRLWVIDLFNQKILYNTYVSHGRNSGVEFANDFSNSESSYKSSLGFYTTGECYKGKHGLSLKLDGQERGINDNARKRAVVIHGANYANPSILKFQNYLGRSLGCPALPEEINEFIINCIKNKSCFFVYHPNYGYKIASKLIS